MGSNERFEPFDDFEGACDVRIGFKTTNHNSDGEHWMNKLSVNWTRREDDIDPGGRISHAEIMMQIRPNVWKRWSIAKKTRSRDKNGKTRWVSGRVHCKDVDVMHDDYVYIKIFMTRRRQRFMFDFLMSQVDGGFNTVGYWFNFIAPLIGFGTRRYYPGIERTRRNWFCTELITCALQSSGCKYTAERVAMKTSPNCLYRLCSRMRSAMPVTNPTRHINITIG